MLGKPARALRLGSRHERAARGDVAGLAGSERRGVQASPGDTRPITELALTRDWTIAPTCVHARSRGDSSIGCSTDRCVMNPLHLLSSNLHRRVCSFAARTLQFLVLALCGLGATALVAAPAQAATLSSSASGVYTGGGNSSGYTSFSNWLGLRPHYALDFLTDSNWSTIDTPTWVTGQWANSDAKLVLSVPMLPASGATLAQGATGPHNYSRPG